MYLAVLYVVGERVDHRSGSSFGSEQVEFIQRLQSRLEDDDTARVNSMTVYILQSADI